MSKSAVAHASSTEGHEPALPKKEILAEWYTQVIRRAELIENYDIAGCYILRPSSYGMWENVQRFLDTEFKKLGVRNVYFPLFIPKKFLCKEEEHLEGFAPEVAWVTRAGQSDLAEHIAVRPTSETGMYPYVKDWIRSHRDLPMQLNQWCNVVRWEFKQTVPFLRSREFLWQEGHSAFANQADAIAEVYQILDLYARAYEELLCVPVVKGRKSESEKFAGADFTTTIEGFIPGNGRGIQAATSHHLGQNFSKMFEINFLNKEEKHELVYQNSWGFTTRSLGVMVLTHGDDAGLVIPPLVAETQVVIVPIIFKDSADAVTAKCRQVLQQLRDAGIRAIFDDRDNLTPPRKFFHWELRGIPIRLELGPKDIAKNCCVLIRRDGARDAKGNLAKQFDVPLATVQDTCKTLFAQMQVDMLAKAKAALANVREVVTEWSQFVPALNNKKQVLAAWCNTVACEKAIKLDSAEEAKQLAADEFALTAAAKSLCIPADQTLAGRELPEKCFHCANKAEVWCLFGRAQYKRFATEFPKDVPIQMLNLIRFRATAVYPPHHSMAEKGMSGRQAYHIYLDQLSNFLREQTGGKAKIVFKAQPQLTLTGPESEQWDECFVMEYPSANDFMAMVKSPVYSNIVVHRTAAVADSRLIRMSKL